MDSVGLDLSQGSPEWALGINVIIIGLLLAGIALGVGRAFRSRRAWAWGVEELAQAIVNAALLGVLIAWVSTADSLTAGMADASSLSCPQLEAHQNKPLYFARCFLLDAESRITPPMASLSEMSYKLGWLSGLTIEANVITARPFFALADVSSSYWSEASEFAGFLSTLQIHSQFLSMVASLALGLFLPAGLLLRMFFATRKLGGALIAASVGFYIVYPLAYSALASPESVFAASDAASSALSSSLSSLSAVPIVDLGKTGDVALLIANLSGGTMPSSATLPFNSLGAAKAAFFLSLVAYPIAAMAITLVAIRELYAAFSSEFNLDLFGII